ncbi:MAG: hypothetical protein EXR09_09490 [Acetobacteraceae bacterium]|nr:hypothetical protein [Acetobacteraceae bacterium]
MQDSFVPQWSPGAVSCCAGYCTGGSGAAGQTNTDNAFGVLPGCEAFLLDPVLLDGFYRAGKWAGVVEGVLYTAALVGTICSLPGVSQGQDVRIGIKHIDAARPDRRCERFAKRIHEALTAAWPCRRSAG